MAEEINDDPQAQAPADPEVDAADLAPVAIGKDAEPIVVPDSPDELDESSPLPYPVVGIGASAGGVEAFVELFRALPDQTGMSFVVIPHLLPDHKSHMVEIIGRVTAMQVSEIQDGSRPEPDHVYVLPPGSYVRLENGELRLENRPADGINRPIDFFFRSLGADQKTRALGVILSGTDSDGALGLKSIKGEGGITMVQSPESAQFPEMPRSSISVDHVDRILPPGLLANELAQLGNQYREPIVRVLDSAPPPPDEETPFNRILALMRGVSGIDFRLYKPTTVRRRVARRMMLHRLHTFAEYAAFLQGNAKELRELQEDALINVTRFFRDPAVFENFKQVILPRMFEDRPVDQQVRIWVAGCSTGEEAYSIAICLLEYFNGHSVEPPIQIFGTDASDHNIQRARLGIFPESIVAEVSPERLRRFFIKVDKGYQVSKRVRDLCIFARQNLCNDPPFSKMDLISCRNVLIYLGTELQKQILPTFHYALRQNGHLLLGATETIRDFTGLFHLIDRRHKFFAKIGVSATRGLYAIPHHLEQIPAPQPQPQPFFEAWGDIELQRAADRIVLARYGPAGVVIDERLEILQSRGHTGPYLEMPQGTASLQLTRMLRDSIAGPVNEAVRHAIDQDVPIRLEGLRVQDGEEEREVTLEVLPIHTLPPRGRSFLVLFVPEQKSRPLAGPADEPPAGAPEDDRAVVRMRQDLASNKLYLQSLLEERDARNQELVSANEEIQSANEELQSTNEELETTKEELQSSNEELQTVNDELNQRNLVLTQTTNDLSNLLNSVNLPVLMLNNDLHIRHFTPPTQRLMNLRSSDIGRPFSDIRLNLQVEDLQPVFTEVLDTLAPREFEVQDRDNHWHMLRVRPYRTNDNKIEGVVVVLLDIDQLRRGEQELRDARDFSRSVLESVPLPLAVVDLELRVRAANDAFRALAGVTGEQIDRRSLPDLAAVAWGLDEPLRQRLEELRAAAESNTHARFEFDFTVPGGKSKVFQVRGRVLKPDSGMFLLVTLEDVTPQLEATRMLAEDRERLSREAETAARELGRTQENLRALAGSLLNSQENERRRVARELHDDICQKLAALEISAQQVAQRMAGHPEEAFAELEHVRAGISSLSDDVRSISHRIHPAVIEDLGLVPALRGLVEDFREREHMIATFSARGVRDHLPVEIASGLYRIAQEALRNVAKHAGKTHVKVALSGNTEAIRLQVIDAGEGFDIHERRSGLGLISMEERTRMMRGTFRIQSELGEGTRVVVDVPLAETASE